MQMCCGYVWLSGLLVYGSLLLSAFEAGECGLFPLQAGLGPSFSLRSFPLEFLLGVAPAWEASALVSRCPKMLGCSLQEWWPMGHQAGEG